MKTCEKQNRLWSSIRGSVLLFLLLFSLPVLAQNINISGKVSDEFGEGVIGASILIKGTSKGTITDIDGNYSLLDVASGAELEFSYLGMKSQTVKVSSKTIINIVLQENSELLDEVVVTALGMKREQKALGYAVTEVKGDELKAANSISPVSALQGKVAGVEIAQSDGGMFGASKIQIRGASTLSGNNQPIYVVDGVILDNNTSGNTDLNWGANANDYGNELKNLNPDDFETVSVLKGAAATALYGSRGLNGAVIITTKSGKGAKGLGVSISQTVGIDVNIAYPQAQYEFGYGGFPGARGSYGSGASADARRWDPNGFYLNSNGEPTLKGAPGAGSSFGPRFDGRPIENYDGTMTTYSPYRNGIKDYYQVGFNTNTNVSIRGGNDTTTFYSSLSYKKAESTTPNNTFDRYSFLLKASHKLTDKLSVEGSVSFAHSKPRNAAPEIGLYSVYGGVYNYVRPNDWKNKYLGNHGGIASTSYGDEYGYVPGTVKSLWWNRDHANDTHREYVVRPTFEVNYQIVDWLAFKAEANMNLYTDNYQSKVLGSGYQNDGGSYSLSSYSKEQITTAGTFSGNKVFGDFSVGGFFRGEFYAKREQSNGSSTRGGLVVPGEYFIENSKETPTQYAFIGGTKRMASIAFAINTSWKDQLYLDVTGRNDWSSALVYSNATGNNSYFYPSVSGSWLVSNSFKLPEWISFAKLRASWAQVGNDTNPYRINPGYNLGYIVTGNGNIYTNSFSSDQIYDSNIKPERKNAWEIGLDFRVLYDRIALDATYYRENTKDQIMSIDVSELSGVRSKLVNAGNIQNSGIEIALKTIPFQNKDWQWGVDMTFTRNRSKIVSLHPDVADYIALRGQPNNYDYRIGSVAKVGGEYGVLMTDALPKRNENGDILLNWSETNRAAYAQRDGTVKEFGSSNPDFLSSLSTSLTWKKLSLRVALDARFGGYVASYANRYGTGSGTTKTSLKYREGHGGMTWTSQDATSGSAGYTYHDGMIPEGVFAPGTSLKGIDGNTYDVSGRSYQELYDEGILEPMHAGTYHAYRNDWGVGVVNDDWVSKLSYIALREVTLSYRFDKAIAQKFRAQGLSMSLTGRNLGYLYNSLPNNVNPEGVRGNESGEFRIRSFNPYTASFMFSVNVDF